MKVGEYFTTERIVPGGTGYLYAPVLLTGGVALIDQTVTPVNNMPGAPEIQQFTFQFLRTGKAEIQFARFRPFDVRNAIYEDVFPFYVEPGMLKSSKVGGYTPFQDLEKEDQDVFDAAFKGLDGVAYKPLKVSKQIVAGTNYIFMCEAEPVIKEPAKHYALVKIFAPLPGQGEPQITDIHREDF